MKKPGVLILLISFTLACSNEQQTIIKGRYPGDAHDYIYVNRINLDNAVFVDSARIDRSGKFRIKIEHPEPAYYTLGFDEEEFISLVTEPGDRINVEFKGKDLQDNYTISGSEESEKVRLLDKKLGQTVILMDSLTAEYRSVLEEGNNPEKASEIEQQYILALDEQRKYNIGFILDNLNKLSAVKALYQKVDEDTYVLYQQRDLQYFKLVSDSLGRYYPDISISRMLKKNLEDELNQMYLNRITRQAAAATPVELDAYLPDINGKRVRLSDLMESNYVLLSFWSAESKECISNNLYLKQMYQLYHRQGFEIYHVNLDNDQELWKRSVRFDELPWISVREDDPSNPVTARIFNVSRLPANYLFDMNGEIIGKDLFGRSLKIKLGQIFD
ncbi:MAG: redoxin domain-containing protein [Bacteroidales bacterium]|nr:redoxin domain-containing protein [Bacteroidales bacterium]